MSQYFNVHAIKDAKMEGNVEMYLVKWEGLPESANSWEPEKNLRRCEKLVQEFKKKQMEERRREANEDRGKRAEDREAYREAKAKAKADALAQAQAQAQPEAQAQAQAPAQYIYLHGRHQTIILPAVPETADPANDLFRVVKQVHGMYQTQSGEVLIIVSGEDGKKVSITMDRVKEICPQLFVDWVGQNFRTVGGRYNVIFP